MRVDRRQFLTASAVALTFPLIGDAAEGSPPKRVAFLGTEVRKHSHAQHFLDRLTEGYTWGGRWQVPRVQVASVFLDQFPDGDLGKHRIQKHGLRQFSTIEETLTLGGTKLDVDGVVIIAEHGDYPTNDQGQKRYPRYEWFKKSCPGL